jgi:hypothetical protein
MRLIPKIMKTVPEPNRNSGFGSGKNWEPEPRYWLRFRPRNRDGEALSQGNWNRIQSILVRCMCDRIGTGTFGKTS